MGTVPKYKYMHVRILKLIKKNLYNAKKICVISDNRIPKVLLNKLIKSLKKYQLKIYRLHVSEKTKSLTVANKIIDQLLEENFIHGHYDVKIALKMHSKFGPIMKCKI